MVEPPGGHFTRTFGPFADDRPHPDRSLWWWYYNASKKSVVHRHDHRRGRRRPPQAHRFGRHRARGGATRTAGIAAGSTTPTCGSVARTWCGRRSPAMDGPAIDPPSRGRTSPFRPRPVRPGSTGTTITRCRRCGAGGARRFQIAGVHAALGTLTALVHRDVTGVGQHVDVSAFAACNVTTESGTFFYLVAGQTPQRQTGRHAAVQPTMEVQVQAGDGRYVTTGFPPHEAEDFRVLLAWLDELGLRESCPEVFFLQIGIERGGIDRRQGVERSGGDRDIQCRQDRARAYRRAHPGGRLLRGRPAPGLPVRDCVLS